MMPTIRIEQDVFTGLQSLAEPFTDTPNTVIRRLLEERGVLPSTQSPKKDSDPPSTKRRRAQGLTKQVEYERFLLHTLATKFSGIGNKSEITAAVLAEMKSRGVLGPADMEQVSTGETKAANTIAWARNSLKERGLISQKSRRGVWELTPEGLKAGKDLAL